MFYFVLWNVGSNLKEPGWSQEQIVYLKTHITLFPSRYSFYELWTSTHINECRGRREKDLCRPLCWDEVKENNMYIITKLADYSIQFNGLNRFTLQSFHFYSVPKLLFRSPNFLPFNFYFCWHDCDDNFVIKQWPSTARKNPYSIM